MREEINRELLVEADRADVWEQLTDVEEVAAWLPALGSVTELAPRARYRALLEDRVGPFTLRADLDIKVVRMDEPVEVAIRARGEDRQVRSRIMIDASAQLTDAGPGRTGVRLSGSYEVTGRVATLGAGVIRSKASKLVDGFCARAVEGLA